VTEEQEPAEELELDSPALLRAATRAGCPISSRQLEELRAQDLLPRPRRVGYHGRAPIWRYEPGTDRQLVTLLQWRQHTKDPDLLKILLWLDGYPIPVSDVRDALSRQLRGFAHTMEHEIDRQARRLGGDLDSQDARQQAVGEIARTLAAKRGTTPVPRHNRIRASDREHAVELLIRSFGLGETIDSTAADGELIERLLGLAPKARHPTADGTEPWLTGPAEDLLDASSIVALPRLLQVVSEASDAELVSTRQAVIALFRYLPLMMRMLGAITGDDNYAGLAAIGQMGQHPELIPYIVPAVLAMLRAGWTDNLNTVTSALQQFPELAGRVQRLLDMPAKTVEANLASLPADAHERAQRLIDAAINGQLETPTTGPT
jgi:hypothetical protein